MERYKCSVCEKELTNEEVKNYLDNHDQLDFNWGQCNGEDAFIIPIKTSLEEVKE